MSIGNLKTEGNKGNNFPYQLSNLQLLGAIAASVAPPGGLATEATLAQVLAAIQNGTEFEQLIVMDLGGVGCPAACPTYIQVRVWDPQTQTFGPPVYYNAAGAVVVPVGPLQLVNPQYVLESMLVQLTAINGDLDVALSTRASEATLLLANALLTQIQTNTLNTVNGITSANLTLASILAAFNLEDFATETTLLTRLSKADFEARINTFGQKLMAASTPVVLASDQSPIPTTLPTGVQAIASLLAVVGGTANLAATATSIGFTTDSLFVGTINGVARNSSTFYGFEAEPGKTLAAIAYTISAGSLILDTVT